MMRYDSTTLHALHDSMVLDSAAETWRVLTYHEMFLREGLKGWAQWMTTCFLPISGYCKFRSGNSMINANNSNNENCSCSFAFLQLFLPKVLRGGHCLMVAVSTTKKDTILSLHFATASGSVEAPTALLLMATKEIRGLEKRNNPTSFAVWPGCSWICNSLA